MSERRPGRASPTRNANARVPSATTAPPAEPRAFIQHVRELTNHRAEIRALAAAELVRMQGTLAPDASGAVSPRALSPRARRQAYINALQTWQKAAAARLE